MSTSVGDDEFFPSLLTGGPSSPKNSSKENDSMHANRRGLGEDTPWAVKRGPRLTFAESLSMEKKKAEPKLADIDMDESPFNFSSSSSYVRRRQPHHRAEAEDDAHDEDVAAPPTSSLADPTSFLSSHLQTSADHEAYRRSAAIPTVNDSSASFFQGDDWGYDRQYWVTVYGFPASTKAFILQQFQAMGEVINYTSGAGNWLHVRYHTRLQAEKALSYDGQTLADNVMIGVKKCRPAEIQGVQQEPASRLYFSQQSRRNPGSKDLEVEPIREEDIMLPPQPRQDICSRVMSFLFNW